MIEHVPPTQVWKALRSDPLAQLVDVRTDAEWTFVGLPDLAATGKRVVLIQWQVYPTMQSNEHFMSQLTDAGFTPDHHIYFLCRSGHRSAEAVAAAQAAGFPNAFNVAEGFEGPPDGDGHRGTIAGWKARGLPWRQH